MYARNYSRNSMLQNYALRHILNISDLRGQMQKLCKKVFRMFGGYVKKLYLCTRNRERCGSD